MYLSTYFGPVIVAEYENREKATSVRKCLNDKCNRRKPLNDKFCPQCGVEATSVSGPNETYIYPSEKDLSEAFEKFGLDIEDERIFQQDYLMDDYFHVFTSNIPGLSRKTYPENCYIDMEEFDIKAEKKWLEETHAIEIQALKSVYKSVSIKWIFSSSIR